MKSFCLKNSLQAYIAGVFIVATSVTIHAGQQEDADLERAMALSLEETETSKARKLEPLLAQREQELAAYDRKALQEFTEAQGTLQKQKESVRRKWEQALRQLDEAFNDFKENQARQRKGLEADWERRIAQAIGDVAAGSRQSPQPSPQEIAKLAEKQKGAPLGAILTAKDRALVDPDGGCSVCLIDWKDMDGNTRLVKVCTRNHYLNQECLKGIIASGRTPRCPVCREELTQPVRDAGR